MSRADRYQPLLLLGSIAIGLGLAAAAPGFAGSLGVLVSAGVLALIFLAMLGVDLSQVTSTFTNRRFVGVAVVVNFVVNPLIAWGLAHLLLSGQPDLQAGLILFLVTPCIGWYLMFTELAGGDVGLGVGLLGINLVLQLLLLPAYLWLFLGTTASVDHRAIVWSVVLFLVVPTIGAWLTRWVLTRLGSGPTALNEVVGRLQLKTITLAVVIIAMFASQGDELTGNWGVVFRIGPPLLLFFGLSFGVAIVAARLAGLPYEELALLVFTATSRNSEASLAIAVTSFASPLVALTVVIGPVVELPLLVLMVRALVARRPDALDGEPGAQATKGGTMFTSVIDA